MIDKELDTRLCTEKFDSTATNGSSLSKTNVISDLNIVENNATIPGCHSDLQSKCHCVVHVMQVNPKREEPLNLSLTLPLVDVNSSNAEILSPSKGKSAGVLDKPIKRNIVEDSENEP